MKIRQLSILMSRIALFVVYVWFGALKVVGQSPASPLVQAMFEKTVHNMIPSLSFATFILLFGLFEVLIGFLFIIPRLEKVALVLFSLQMITAWMPLFVLPAQVWTHAFVPTLEGQYIIKNLALIACALSVWSAISPKTGNGTRNSLPHNLTV